MRRRWEIWERLKRRKRLVALLVPLALLVLLAGGAGIATAAGVDFTRRQVPEVSYGIEAYEEGDFDRALKRFEQGRTDITEEEGKLWLDRGLAQAQLEQTKEAGVSLRRAAGDAKTDREVRSEAHYALGNLALEAHEDLDAIEEYRQALRLWPGNRDAAWNLSLARRRLEIDDCRLIEPTKLEVEAGQETDEIKGEVFEEHRTEKAAALEGLQAELGFGPDGSDPRDKIWAWKRAEYAGETEEGSGERYAAKIKAPRVGRFDYALRFKQPGGEWAYCDQDGWRTEGYASEQAGDLMVRPPGTRCQLLGPAWLITAPGDTSDPVELALAVAEGTTLGEVEVGYGPDGSEPGSEEWSWSAAESIGVTTEAAGTIAAGSPRYRGRLQVSDNGRYDYAFRIREAGSDEWVTCDLNGSADGYQPQAAGDLVVRELPDEGCLLDRPPRTSTAPSQPTEPIRGLVHQEGEPLEPIRVEVGLGPDNSNPSEGQGWTWTEAASAEDAPEGWAAYAVGPTAPGEQGSYDYAVRMRRGGESAPWVICDLDGSTDGYETSMAGDLLVQESQSQDQQDQQQDEEEQEEQEDQQDQQDEQEPQQEQEQEEQQLPQDMESVLDALQQNEQTFLPPRTPRRPARDW